MTSRFLSVLLLACLAPHPPAKADAPSSNSANTARDSSDHSPKLKKKKKTRNRRPHPESQQLVALPTPEEDEETRSTKDPLEPVNRGIFAFNHQLYRFITKPLARFTDFILPEPVRDGIANAFDNLKAPVRISASLLQGKGKVATQETAKLLINSTAGVGGLWKPSDRVTSLKNIPEADFGQTFGKWGCPAGVYLVVPVLGPRNLRDLAGEAANTCASPLTWVGSSSLRVWVSASDNIQRNPGRMRVYDDATKDALDPYIAMREGYSNYRASLISR